GGEWPRLARDAAKAQSGVSDDQDKGIELLRDIRRIFKQTRLDRFGARSLVSHLIALEEAPWADWRSGKPISDRGVAVILNDYGIKSRKGRAANEYYSKDFEQAFASYLGNEETPHDVVDAPTGGDLSSTSSTPQ